MSGPRRPQRAPRDPEGWVAAVIGLRARLDRWAVAVERAAAPDLESRWAETDRWVDACLGLVALRHRLRGAVDVLATPRSSTEHTQSSRRAEDMLR